MSNEEQVNALREFEEKVKASVNIMELYTHLTGEQFLEVKGRLRARIVWRHDETPSLCYVPDKNLLTDFTDQESNSNKPGVSYNPIHIFIKVGGAINYRDGLRMLCEYAKMEMPAEFLKGKDDNNLPVNIGKAIKIVWQECLNRRTYLLKNKDKIPQPMVDFFNKTNIPFDNEFCDIVNIGIAPDYDLVLGILKDHGITLKKKKDKDGNEQELNIFSKIYQNNALVFPLYNEYGALCGLKFRRLDVKDHQQWLPVTNSCFYNLHLFSKRPRTKMMLMVEGEKNLLAYAISAWRHYKASGDENIKNDMLAVLSVIFSTGSKSNDLSAFKGELPKVLYFPDYDLTGSESTLSDDAVLSKCIQVSQQIDAVELDVIDWTNVNDVKDKYDFEDYLKANNYDITCIVSLPRVSLAQYCINVIEKIASKIKNPQNAQVAQINLALKVSEKLSYGQRVLFKQLAEQKFNLTEEIGEEIETDTNAKFGNYLIKNGGIVKEVKAENDKIFHYPMTNFYVKLITEITKYNEYDNNHIKRYEVKIIAGKDVRTAFLEPSDVVDSNAFLKALYQHHSMDKIKVYEPEFLKHMSSVIQLMKEVSKPVRKHLFSSLGRPQENIVEKLFKTDMFCLAPNVSIINGKIIKNHNFEVILNDNLNKDQDQGKKYVEKYSFSDLNNDELKEAFNLFWSDLRKLHDPNIMSTLISFTFDSCTRELHGKDIPMHGFTIILEGQSGTNKTTAMAAAMSLLGDFKESQDLLVYNSTTMSIEHTLISAGTSVVGLDELKAETITPKDFINLIHSVYGAPSRQRMASNHTVKGGVELQCGLMITSEGLGNGIPESIASRMVVFRLEHVASEIKREREKHLRNWQANSKLMKGILPQITAWMHNKTSKPYIASIEKWKKEFKPLISMHDNHERVVDMTIRIVAAWEMICDFIAERNIAPQKEVEEVFGNFVKFWKREILIQMKRVKSKASAVQTIDLLGQMIDSNIIGVKMVGKREGGNNGATLMGNIKTPITDVVYENGERKLLLVAISQILKEMTSLAEVKILQSKFENDMKEAGLIDVNPDGSFKKYKIPNNNGIVPANGTGFVAIDYNKFVEYRAKI